MKFYKFRRQGSSSPGTWEYIRLPEGETPKSFFDEMEREDTLSEYFRGLEFKKIKAPPKEWLQSEIESFRKQRLKLNHLANEYLVLLNDL